MEVQTINIRDIEFAIVNHDKDNSFEIEAVSKDKKKWKSLKINQESAKELTNGVYSFPQLKQIVELILINSQSKNEPDLSARLTPVKQDFIVIINIQEKFGSRELSIPFDLQDVDDIWVLRKLLEEKDKKIASLTQKLEETNKIASEALEKVSTLAGSVALRLPIVVRHEKREEQEYESDWQGVKKQPSRVDVCNVILPPGEWLVQYRYEFSTYGPSYVWIPFTICYGQTLITKNGYNHDFGAQRSAGCSGASDESNFVIVSSNGKDQLFVKLFDSKSHKSGNQQTSFWNITLCCTPVQLNK